MRRWRAAVKPNGSRETGPAPCTKERADSVPRLAAGSIWPLVRIPTGPLCPLQFRSRVGAPWGLPLPSFPLPCLRLLDRFLFPEHCPTVPHGPSGGVRGSACSCRDFGPGAALHPSFIRSLARALSRSSAPFKQPLRRPLSAAPLTRRARTRPPSAAKVPRPLRATLFSRQAPRRARPFFSRFFRTWSAWCWPQGFLPPAPGRSPLVLLRLGQNRSPVQSSECEGRARAGLPWLRLQLPRDFNHFSSSHLDSLRRWVSKGSPVCQLGALSRFPWRQVPLLLGPPACSQLPGRISLRLRLPGPSCSLFLFACLPRRVRPC